MAKENEKSPMWREVTIGGISGILLGSVGTIFASDIHNQNEAKEDQLSEETNEETQETESVNVPYTGALASSVNDSMSFGDAFAAARSEIGAGGYFVWHGNVYGTYYANEWNSMSEAQHEQFYSAAPQASHSYHTTRHATSNVHTEHSTETASNATPTNQQNHPENEETDDDFQIIGVDRQNIDGEHMSNIGVASIGGHAAYFVDVDGEDDRFEFLAVDVNGNSKIEENEWQDISGQNIHVSTFQEMAQANHQQDDVVQQYYADNQHLPDYVNDADPADLA